jgi:DNA-binding XRE family transcriptional regulator
MPPVVCRCGRPVAAWRRPAGWPPSEPCKAPRGRHHLVCPSSPGLRGLAALPATQRTLQQTAQLLGAQMPRSAINPIDKHVGSRVRMRRLMLDMSQTDVADALGLTFQQVQKYEKGTNRIGACSISPKSFR